MKKTIIYISVGIIILILLYTICWFTIAMNVAHTINRQYGNKNINMQLINKNALEYYIKFTKISPCGFPFKLAFQVAGWQEEGPDNTLELRSPLNIGYDFITKSAFIAYSGEVIGRYKPVERGFGVIFNTKHYSCTIKIPFSMKLFTLFSQQRNIFEIINFIKEVKLHSEQTQIFDLVDHKKLYDEDYNTISFSLERRKYYLDIEDFKNNVPQKLNINYAINITQSNIIEIMEGNIIKRQLPAGILFYKFAWPVVFNFDGKFSIKTNKLLLSEFTKDVEVDFIATKIGSKLHESVFTLLYHNKVENNDNLDSYLKINSTIDLKSGISATFLNSLQYLLAYTPTSLINSPWFEELRYISNNPEKFSLHDLENRRYLFDLDINFISRPRAITRVQINNLSLFSNNTGFKVASEYNLIHSKEFKSAGLIVLHNYQKITALITDYLFNLKQFRSFSQETKDLYKDTIQDFLKSISDHPESISRDLSFEYTLESNNMKQSKIGTVEVDKITPLYYVTLYKNVTKRLRAGEQFETRIRELVPNFTEHPEFLKRLIQPPLVDIVN